MPPELQLSWIASLKQWRKRRFINGKRKDFYLGTGTGKNDLDSYQRALTKWKQIEAKLAADQEQNRLTQRLDELTTVLRMTATPEHRTNVQQAIAELQAGVSLEELDERTRHRSEAQIAARLGNWAKVSEHAAVLAGQKKTENKLGTMLDTYLKDQERRYQHGLQFPDAPQSDRIGPSRFIGTCNTVKLLKEAWGDKPLPQDEGGLAKLMMQYRELQQTNLTQGKIKRPTFNERIKTMRHFVRWAHRKYLIPSLPRNMAEICAAYKYKPCAKALDLDLIRRLWSEADNRMKLYMALSLNCGFYAIDIGYLEHAHIKGSHIMADRHKTGVPTRFKLWSVTQRLLELERSNHNRLALVDKHGKPLYEFLVQGRKGYRRCSIDNKLSTLCRRLGIKGVSFSKFRDTSTTLIEGINRSCTDIFDGHKDSRMAVYYIDADKRDLDRMFSDLDLATDQLDRIYGLSLNEPQIKARSKPKAA